MKRKLKILVLTASNAAVDIIAKRLMHIREKMIGNGMRFELAWIFFFKFLIRNY